MLKDRATNIDEIKANLPDETPHLFISSVAHKGLDELKDQIWKKLN